MLTSIYQIAIVGFVGLRFAYAKAALNPDSSFVLYCLGLWINMLDLSFSGLSESVKKTCESTLTMQWKVDCNRRNSLSLR